MSQREKQVTVHGISGHAKNGTAEYRARNKECRRKDSDFHKMRRPPGKTPRGDMNGGWRRRHVFLHHWIFLVGYWIFGSFWMFHCLNRPELCERLLYFFGPRSWDVQPKAWLGSPSQARKQQHLLVRIYCLLVLISCVAWLSEQSIDRLDRVGSFPLSENVHKT